MKYKIWLLMLNVNNNEKLKLLEKFGSEEEVFNRFDEFIRENTLLYKRFASYNKKTKLLAAENLIGWMKINNVGFITINDEGYPISLKEINEPPYGLFYKGNIDLLKERIVSIVGSRVCTTYGKEVTKLLTKELISYNITIISGGAKGVDAVAHETSIKCSGNTIVVLGCGIDIVYPAQNFSIFKEVEEKGLILSEFIPGTPPLAYNFPRRNRIISGLSELIIVVEASEKSGSLITASYAAEQGRDVMAVPGPVFSKGSNGCNKLIKDGAYIFCDLDDLYTILKLECKQDNRIISPVKQKILSIIENEPIHINDIINRSYVDREALFKVLFEMQIGNEIISLPGNYYAKIT
ncbi:DNA-processing protein DprA [Clostridium paraputrificum]|uniref:DNA-processing protein DprA n=1 Tax=Clostridium TaxID=1485 RepID=UPI003D3599C0